MRIAVLMSTYNGEKYIRDQIDSILKQEGAFLLDLWARDDGSTDDTINILRRYEKDGKLNWYSGNHLGPAYSFLDLVRHCPEYDYYAFADQDDDWLPGKLAAGLAALEKHGDGIALYLCNAELVDAELKPLGRLLYKRPPATDFKTLVCAGGLPGCMMMFGKAVVNLLRDKELPPQIVLHDYYLAIVCTALGGDVLYDDAPYIRYRQHAGNFAGVQSGVRRKIADRLMIIARKKKTSIADQAASVLKLYASALDPEKAAWLDRIAHYRKSLFSRVKLGCTRQVRYVSMNMGFALRMSTILGNQ